MIKVYVGNNINRTPIDVTSDTTLRRAFEEAEVDYGSGTNSLDGATLKAGDLDKTFEEMGVTGEKCYLMNIAKAVNAAAGIKVLAGTVAVEVGYTPDQIKEISRYRPDAMKLKDEKGAVLYTVAKVAKPNGCMNGVGAEFGDNVTAAGKAVIKMEAPVGADIKKWIEETIGVSILKLQKVESQWEDALDEIAKEKAAVLGTIEEL